MTHWHGDLPFLYPLLHKALREWRAESYTSPMKTRLHFFPRLLLRLGILLGGLALMLWGLDLLFPPHLKRLQDLSPLMLDRDGQILCVLLSKDEQKRLYAAPSQVSPRYLQFLVGCEDQRFWYHWGVDPWALGRAFFQYLTHGHVVSGGSTLTMQTARLLEPRPRTLLAKILEILRAFQLEFHYTKEEILGFYLTLAPFGGNIEGVQAASFLYFGKSPQDLTDAQAALLVALPQSPTALRPQRYPQRALAARGKILERVEKQGLVTAQERKEARDSLLPGTCKRFPALARHLLQNLVLRHPSQRTFKTTLRQEVQEALETLLAREVLPLEPEATLAALVVENETGDVLAYSGSALFHDDQRHGQVNIVRAIRSPGSTLKPAIYALAFQDQILHPDTLINDREMRFLGYHPKNFNDIFHGVVSIREALQQSLNIPAVAVLERIGPGRFMDVLKKAGLQFILKEKNQSPSLPIALGGLGTTLWDLVTLYTSFSRQGTLIHPRVLQEETPREVSLFTPVAAWYIIRILEESPAPEKSVDWRLSQQAPIAYKTGTAYGYRDGWAIGTTPAYTVGVWSGRPDGLYRAGSTGREAAAPLLFKVFAFLPSPAHLGALSVPPGIIGGPHGTLPPALQYFRTGQEKKDFFVTGSKLPALTITFPLPHTRLSGFDSVRKRFSPLSLTAIGGIRPLTWLVNGQLVSSSPFERGTTWTPDGRGFTHIVVIDSAGQSASIDVEIF